jgi:hypothetical protein
VLEIVRVEGLRCSRRTKEGGAALRCGSLWWVWGDASSPGTCSNLVPWEVFVGAASRQARAVLGNTLVPAGKNSLKYGI